MTPSRGAESWRSCGRFCSHQRCYGITRFAAPRLPASVGEEHKRAQFNAASRWRASWRGRVVERRVSARLGNCTGALPIDLQQQRFFRTQLQMVIPAIIGVGAHRKGFVDLVALHQLTGQKVRCLDSASVAQRQRGGEHRTANGSPKIDDCKALKQPFLGFLGG